VAHIPVYNYSTTANRLIRRHEYDLAKTFEVIVGKAPFQQRFTAHHDLLVQRSEFFRAARASCWTEAGNPTTLEDHDPAVFSTYLHCLYFGAGAIKDRLSSIVDDPPSSDDDSSDGNGSTTAISTNAAGAEGESCGQSSPDGDTSENGDTGNGSEDRCQKNVVEGTPETLKRSEGTVKGEVKKATAILFVGNLDFETEEGELRRAFEEFGEVKDVRIVTRLKTGRSLGYGYVEFTDVEDSVKALRSRGGYELDGRNIRVDFASPRNKGGRDSQDAHNGPAAKPEAANVSKDLDVGIEGSDGENNTNDVPQPPLYDHHGHYEHFPRNRKDKFLVDLYILADKLIDPVTANLTIDELTTLPRVDADYPGCSLINFLYDSTLRTSPLRKLVRD
jgi:hypothetical protein